MHRPAPALDVVGDRVADRRGRLHAAEARHVRVAVFEQVPGRQLRAADVVRDDRDVVDRLRPLVQQHDPCVPRLYLGRRPLAGPLADQDQPGDPHSEEGPQVVDLAFVAVVGIADQDHFPALRRGLFDRVRHLCEERLPGVRNDHSYEIGPPRRHRLRDPVGPVTQLLDRASTRSRVAGATGRGPLLMT